MKDDKMKEIIKVLFAGIFGVILGMGTYPLFNVPESNKEFEMYRTTVDELLPSESIVEEATAAMGAEIHRSPTPHPATAAIKRVPMSISLPWYYVPDYPKLINLNTGLQIYPTYFSDEYCIELSDMEGNGQVLQVFETWEGAISAIVEMADYFGCK